MIRRLSILFWVWLLPVTLLFADQGGNDNFGYMWTDSKTTIPANKSINYQWIDVRDGTSVFTTNVDDSVSGAIDLPFSFSFYGSAFSTIYISTNGFISFHSTSAFPQNRSISSLVGPDSIIAPFWDDLAGVSSVGNVYYNVVGTSPNRKFVIQWDNFYKKSQPTNIGTFEVVLYENSNLIKFQYNNLIGDSLDGSRQTIGIGLDSDGIDYSYNQSGAVSSRTAILFHPDSLGPDADGSITPASAVVGTNFQEFTYTLQNIDPASTNDLGKVDRLAIFNPFEIYSVPTVISVSINGEAVPLQYSTSAPTEEGVATWYRITDSIIVQTSPFNVKDSLKVNFVQSMPPDIRAGEYASYFDARLDLTANQVAQDAGWTVSVVPGAIAYYSVTPSTLSTTAGSNIAVTVEGYDENDNPVTNDDTTQVAFSGTGTGLNLAPASGTLNGGQITFSATNTIAERFTLTARSQYDPTQTGTSQVITTTAAAAANISKVSGDGSGIIAGANRLLRVRVRDEYNNVVANAQVSFSVQSGGGSLGGQPSLSVQTDGDGFAEATLTTGTVPGTNTVRAALGTNPAINVVFSVSTVPGGVSYYTVIPSAYNATAGNNIDVTVTGYDANNNVVSNDNSTVVEISGTGTGLAFTPPSATLAAGIASFAVSDTVAERFTLSAFTQNNSTERGTSNLITVNPAGPADFTVSAGAEDDMIVGTERLLSVRLFDTYGNPVPGSTVTFQRQTGTGVFPASPAPSQDSIQITTDNSGLASANYRASSAVSGGSDEIAVTSGAAGTTITIPLITAPISRFQLTVLSSLPALAGDTVLVQVEALDIYDNPVVSSESYQMSAIGLTASFIPSSTYSFTNGSRDTISVRATSTGSFTVQAQLASDPAKQGSSSEIRINPAPLAKLVLRSLAGNKGTVLSGTDFSINSSQSLAFYAAGYDEFDNYIDDIDAAAWNSTGTLNGVVPLPYTGSGYTFEPVSAGTGRINISVPASPGVSADTTGIITVSPAALSYIKIQSDSTAGGPEIGSRSFAAGDTLRLYAVGYDIDNNWLGKISSNWTINNSVIGSFENGQQTLNDAGEVLFTADGIGNGVISAAAASAPAITDQTGLFTVNGGAISYIRIRSAANNAGFLYRDNPTTITTDNSIALFAASYDAHDNYLGDISVSWTATGLTGVPAGPASSIQFSPALVESGTIQTNSPYVDDATALITVNPGALSKIRIQDSPLATGNEVGAVSLTAGNTLTLYAVGYDKDNNLTASSQISSNWSLEGDAIGTFSSANPSVSNTLTAQSTGSAVVRATQDGGSLFDITSTISVTSGPPSSLLKIAGVDSQTAAANTQLPRDIGVVVYDQYMNPVEGVTVNFLPMNGGSVSDAQVATNALGIATTRWTLHSDTTSDHLAATLNPAYSTTPDSVYFTAFVNSGAPAAMTARSALTYDGTVNTNLSNSFSIAVSDSFGNPVPNTLVNFAIVSRPAGSSNDSLSVYSAVTNSSGEASTLLHLGTKIGTYRVRAYSASTSPSFIEFTGNAITPDAPARIAVVSGDNQTGTAGQPLADSVRFAVFDQYDNRISGQNISFTPSEGSTDPASGATNSAGEFATYWTLGQTSGSQQLTATIPGSSPVVETAANASALPSPASRLALITLRKLPHDSIAALPGENITVTVEARDQFNNIVPNALLRFQTAPGYNAIFESGQLQTNSQGIVTNVLKTDQERDSTFFRVLIPDADTLNLHVYHLQYVAGSLTPREVTPGNAAAFQISMRNNAPYPVSLLPSGTHFRFNDGTHYFDSVLNSPVSLPARNAAALTFNSAAIDGDFSNTGYSPEVIVRGTGADSLLSGRINLPSNSLTLYTVVVERINGEVTTIERGGSFWATMQVSNLGPQTINVNASQSFVYIQGFPTANIVASPSNPAQLPPNSPNNILTYQVNIPGDTPVGQYIINGQFTGTTLAGTPVTVGQANTTFPFNVVTNARIVVQSLIPSVVTTGSSPVFRANLLNEGSLPVVLNPDSSVLRFGSDIFPLAQSYSLPAAGAVNVEFSTHSIATAARAAAYNPQLRLYGAENTAIFDTTITLSQTVLIQNPPQLVVDYLNFIADTAVQNQDSLITQIVLQNSGTLNAPASIINPDSFYVVIGSERAYPASYELVNFPIQLAAGAASDTIDFIYSIGLTHPAGTETVRTEYSFRDNNSGINYHVTPGDEDAFLVQSRSRLALDSHTLSPDTVTKGQTGILFNFTLRNAGESTAQIRNNDLAIQFTNNPHQVTLLSPALPVNLAGGASQQFQYQIDIDSTSGSGWDRLNFSALQTDVRSGKTYNDINISRLDSLFILKPAGTNNLQIQYVQITPYNVNQGQDSIEARVGIRNLSQSPAQLNSLELIPSRPGLSSILRTPLGTIPAGATSLYSFYLAVAGAAAPGLVGIDAGYQATDLISGSTFEQTGSNLPDTLNIQIPADLVISSVLIDGASPDTVSAGKQNLNIVFNATNQGQAGLRLTTVTPVVPAGVTLTRISPSTLPTVASGDTATFVYRADAENAGNYTIDFQAAGTDLNDLSSIVRTSTGPGQLVVRQPGAIAIDSVVVPEGDAVIGQDSILAVVYLRNSGEMPLNVNGVNLTFSPSGFAQEAWDPANFGLDGGESQSVRFYITVLSNSPTGAITVGARAVGTEINLQTALSANAAVTDILQVTDIPRLRITSVTSDYDSVSQAQTGITARVRVLNNGGTGALLSSLQLKFSGGTYTNISQIIQPPLLLPAGANTSINFNDIGVDAASALGGFNINAGLTARDAVSGSTISIENADTTDFWRVVSPANLIYTALQPLEVTTNQQASFALTLRNTGQAYVHLQPNATILNIGTLQIPLPAEVLVPGGQSRNIVFPATPIGLANSSYPASLNYSYLENGVAHSGIINIPDPVVVDNSVSIDTLRSSYPGLLSQNMNLPLHITISNAAGSATAVVDSMVIPQFNYRRQLGTELSGGDSLVSDPEIFVDETYQGLYDNVSVIYYWHDRNSNEAGSSAFSLQPITVLRRAQLVVSDITGPGNVYAGQTDQILRVAVQNAGEATALIDNIHLIFNIGLYTDTLETPVSTIAGGEVDTFVFNVDVDPNTGIGIDNISATITGRDSISGNQISATGTNLHNWEIFQSLQVEILSVYSPNTTISQGQDSIQVAVRIHNHSNSILNLDTLRLYSRHLGDLNYVYSPDIFTDREISLGSNPPYYFYVSVNEDAATGQDTLDARLVAHTNHGNPVITRVDSSTIPHIWHVQSNPELRTTRIQIAAREVSIGQDYEPMSVGVRNFAGTASASARLTDIRFIGADNQALTNNFNILRESVLPLTLGAVDSANLYFRIQPAAAAQSGTYYFRSVLYYEDINSGISYADTSSVLDTLTIVSQPVLTFGMPQLNQYETHWTKTNDTLRVWLRNEGLGTARINGSNVLPVGLPQAIEIKTSRTTPVLPVDLAGGDSILFQYLLDYPVSPGFDTTIQYQVDVHATDVNSGIILNSISPVSGEVRILTPPVISYVPFSLRPSRIDSIRSGIVFELDLSNSGSTSVPLDPATTVLNISEPALISTSLQSVTTVGGNGATTLRFNPVDVNLQDSVYITATELNGAYHGVSLSQNLYTGNLNVGGSLSIEDLTLTTLPPAYAQGDTGIVVRMQVRNHTGNTLYISPANTNLMFRYVPSQVVVPYSLFNLRRGDSNVTLPPLQSTTLEFRFDIPNSGINLGQYWIQGEVEASLNPDGSVPFGTSTAINAVLFNITTGAQISYQENSLRPQQGILGQGIVFRLNIINDGMIGVRLDRNNSYLTIQNGASSFSTYTDANYYLSGKSDPGDPAVIEPIAFNSVNIPSDFLTGSCDLTLHLEGELSTGVLLQPAEFQAQNQFSVLDSARLIISHFEIQPDSVVYGQSGIPSLIEIENTGGSVANLTGVRLINESGNSISSNWVITSRAPSLPRLILPGNVLAIHDTLTLTEQTPVGPNYIGASLVYNDTLAPQSVMTSSFTPLDTVHVLPPGNLRIDSTGVDNLPNPNFVNQSQSFVVRTLVHNTGQEPLRDIRVSLTQNNVPLAARSITLLAAGSTQWITFPVTSPANTTGNILYRTNIDSAFSVLTGRSILPDQPLDNTEIVTVQRQARLRLIVSPTHQNLSINQVFRLSANVLNLGDADFGNGSLELSLPPNYSSVENLARSFTGESTLEWTITALSASGVTDDTVAVSFRDIPLDANTASPAQLFNDSAYSVVRVDSLATISDSILIAGPSGALDSVVSTSQIFEIREDIQFSGSISDSNRTSRIILPSGYAVLDSPLVNWPAGVSEGSRVWRLRAPDNPSGPDQIRIESRGFDTNTEQPVVRYSNVIFLNVVQKAQLALDDSSNIIQPVGSRDGIVSTHQAFKLRIRVRNNGTALTSGVNKVKITLPTGYYFSKYASQRDSLLDVLTAVNPSDYSFIDIFSDTLSHTAPQSIRLSLDTAATDVNSMEPALIVNRTRSLSVSTVKRANLIVNAEAPEAVTQNFQFRIGAVVRNIGSANVLDSSKVWVKIDTANSGFRLLSPDTTLATIGDSVFWNINSLQNAGIHSLGVSILRANIYDENNYPDSLVYISKADTAVQVNVSSQQAISISSLALTSLVFPTPKDSLLASTGQGEIALQMGAALNPVFSQNRFASLILPAGTGFSSDSNLVQNIPSSGIVRWSLKAPATATNDYVKLKVRAQATSEVNGQTVAVWDSVYIRVINRAILSVSGNIISPAGAVDDTVSFGQEFVYQTIIKRSGEAGVLGSGMLRLTADSLLYITDGGKAKSFEKPYDLEKFNADTLNWNVRVDSSAQLTKILSKIGILLARKTEAVKRTAILDDSGNTPPAVPEAAQLDAEINSLYAQIENIISNSSLMSTFASKPNDALTGRPADSNPDTVITPIIVLSRAEIKLSPDIVLQNSAGDNIDTLSTNQTFSVQASLANVSSQIASQRTAQLLFPAGSGFRITGVNPKPFNGTTVTWDVSAPASVAGPTIVSPVKVIVWGVDSNSGQTIGPDTTERSLILEPQAIVGLRLEITDPASARLGRLSYNQEFTVRATITHSGSKLKGGGKINLNMNSSDSIRVLQSDPYFQWPDSVVTWRLKTPNKRITSSINVNFAAGSVPIDKNSGQPAALDSLNGVASIPVFTERYNLTVSRIGQIRPEKFNQQNSEFPIMGLMVENKQPAEGIPILIKGFEIKLLNNVGGALSQPEVLLQKITIVDSSYYTSLDKPSAQPTVYADTVISAGMSNPFTLPFKEFMRVVPIEQKNLIVLVETDASSPNKSFRLQIEKISAFEETTGNEVQVVDSVGNPFNPQSDLSSSELVTVISSAKEKIFSNYPNPFGIEQDYTSFVFWMDGPGSAEIRIYTLLGGLVYSDKKNLPAAGLYDGALRWDGVNNAGNRVLNGVYIAIINIKDGSNKSYKTKIAYIK